MNNLHIVHLSSALSRVSADVVGIVGSKVSHRNQFGNMHAAIVKTFSNIVCFCSLQKRVDDAFALFGDKDILVEIIQTEKPKEETVVVRPKMFFERFFGIG